MNIFDFNAKATLKNIDSYLLIALMVGLVLCIYGMNWGRVESWNYDQMVLRPWFSNDTLSLNPVSFQKPPFHSYLNLFVAEIPARGLRKILGLPWCYYYPFVLLFSRMLTALLFLGSAVLLYVITKRMYSIYESRIIVWLFITSAGIVSFAHFLTADIPVLFWMLSAFYFCQNVFLRHRRSDYIFAGLLTGIATAAKYNGLAIGIAIVIAHLLSHEKRSLKKLIFNKKIIMGLLFVPIGFIVGNPYAILDHSRFISEFMYTYRVTPLYDSTLTGSGYLTFFTKMTEIIGLPHLCILAAALCVIIYGFINQRKMNSREKQVVLLMSVFFLYYMKFGAFTRIEARFILPIMPYPLICSGIFWEKIKTTKSVLFALLTPLIIYNLVCSAFIGYRFLSDPRMKAQEWVKGNVPDDASMLTSAYSPDWSKMCDLNLRLTRMPWISGKNKIFKERFADDKFVMNQIDAIETGEEKYEWYQSDILDGINPDYIALNSNYYRRFLSGWAGELYPLIKDYFTNILTEQYQYKIIFDEKTKEVPTWLYPQNIDFLSNRMVILKKVSEK